MTWDATPAAGVQTGKGVAIAALAMDAVTTIAVTFPQEYAAPPVVEVTPFNARLSWGHASVTTTGFSVSFANWSSAACPGTTFDWVAHPA